MVPFFVSDNPYCRGIVPNISRLAHALRTAGGTVAWVLAGAGEQTSVTDEFFGPAVAELYRTSGGTGGPAERLWLELTPLQDNLLVEKSAASAFFPGRCPSRNCWNNATSTLS